jgi:phage protein D
MAKSTFVKAYLKDIDISDSVESIRDESDVEKGDFVEMRVKSDKALDLANHKDVVAGAKLEYQYGFIGLLHSSLHVARVVNINTDFSDKRVRLEIRALDKGIEIKKNTSRKVWSKVTLSDIAKAIAKDYGLNTDFIEPTSKVYNSIPQGGRSDWDFLQYLVKRESERVQIYVSDYAMYLEKDMRSKGSKRSFTLGENIISFRTQVKEASQKTKIETLPSIDDKTGQPQTAKQTNENSKTELKDGKFALSDIFKTDLIAGFKYDVNGVGTPKPLKNEVAVPTADKQEAKVFQDNLNESNAQKVLTANLVIELDPTLRAGQVITVKVPVEKLSGNWFIEKAVHTIDGNGGLTSLDLNKNGTAKSVKDTPTVNDGKVNNTEGATSPTDTRKIPFFNSGYYDKPK